MDIEKLTYCGGMLWKAPDLAGNDAGHSITEQFLEEHPHQGWSLSIFDTVSESTAEIECDTKNMPKIVSAIYNMEHAYPMTFIGENPMTESYVVGMRCTRGRFEIPGVYKDIDGKLQKLN